MKLEQCLDLHEQWDFINFGLLLIITEKRQQKDLTPLRHVIAWISHQNQDWYNKVLFGQILEIKCDTFMVM